jgi:hypothetical protein
MKGVRKMNKIKRRRLAKRKIFGFVLMILILIIGCLGAISPAAASDVPIYIGSSDRDYLPGNVYIGFKEPYYGSFTNEEFPGLDVAEVMDLSKITYESFLADPRLDMNDPIQAGVMNSLKNNIGIDFRLICKVETKERVWEAMRILCYYCGVNEMEISYIMPCYLSYAEGAIVTGRIRSYNPSQPTTVTLTQNGKEMYKTIIEAEDGSGQVIQDFVFDGIRVGTYSLVVTKQAHLSYTLTDVVVKSVGVDLTQNADPKISIITLPCGDIDGNGYIESFDLGLIILPGNYNKRTTDNGVNPRADLFGTGWVDSSSLGIIILPANYGKSNVVYPYS